MAGYYRKKDEFGNTILDEKDYKKHKEEKSNIPGFRDIKEPELLTEEEENAESAQKTLEKYPEIFKVAGGGEAVKPSDLIDGKLYLTKDAALFTYENSKMIFYSSVVRTGKMNEFINKNKSQTILHNKITLDYFGTGPSQYLVAAVNTPSTEVLVPVIRIDEGNYYDIVNFFVAPNDFVKGVFDKKESENMDDFFSVYAGGKKYIGNAKVCSVQDSGNKLIISGTLWTLSPDPEDLIQASKVEKVIPLTEYLDKLSL